MKKLDLTNCDSISLEPLARKILEKIKRLPSEPTAYEDLFAYCRQLEEADKDLSHQINAGLRDLVARRLAARINTERFYELWKKTLLFDAPLDLDSYLIYLELMREPEKRFYMPRRKVLKQVVDALQDLTDDRLDELFLTMPARVGKTSLMIFYVTWIMGRNSEAPNLYSSYTDIITKSFYNGVLEILQDVNTYAWHDVFPGVDIARTNAADEIIDMGRKKHYPTLTCRSIDGTINGACDAQDGVIISDDLVSGIEEALSKDRLISKWGKVDNNLIPRGKGKTKYLWIGTRWSLLDPTGIRMDVLQNDPKYAGYRWKVINLPALNENDESNFDYPYGVGFDTLYYQRRRASFERNNDLASWNAQYMGEPIERDGALFAPDDFKYYNGELPPTMPDRIFMAVDPSFGGGDFCAGPVCIQYGDDIFVADVLYDNGDKMVTQPLIAAIIEKHGVRSLQVEANKATQPYVDGISAELKKRNVHCTVTTKPAPTTKSKDQRIFDRAPDIREHFIFLETGKRSKPYDLFMQNVFSFKAFAKNKHDDAPDSLSMAADMAFRPTQTIKFFKRTF